jgi:DNA polymerase-4
MYRHIIHLHIPSFPITVARVSQPELRGRPVVVAPPQSERSLILSVSPEARKEGVFKGMPLSKGMKLCPDLTVLPPNPRLMEKVSHSMAELASRYTPIWEPARPGHIYLDVTGTERLWGKAKDTARHLGEEIKDRLYLSGTVGVAGNKMVSNIASRIMISGGVVDVDHGQEAPFMAPLKVNLLPGIGRSRQKVLLEELNIIRVRELAALDMGNLRLIFGRQAYLIHQRAIGIDPTPVCPSPMKPVVAEEVTLPLDENDDHRLLGVLYTLVERCSYRLRSRALFPGKAALLIRYSDQVEAKGQVGFNGMSSLDLDLYRPLERLFLKTCNRRVRVRFMRVWFWDFSRPSPQLSLFHVPLPGVRKTPKLTQALDRIKERHGDEAIKYGR